MENWFDSIARFTVAHLGGLPKSKSLGPNLTMNGGSWDTWHFDSLFQGMGIRIYVTGKVFIFFRPLLIGQKECGGGCTFDRSSRIVKDPFLFKNSESTMGADSLLPKPYD